MSLAYRQQLIPLTLLLTLAYVASGKLGLLLAIPPGYATAIFPAAGLALTAVLLVGARALPGVALGSALMNLWISLEAGNPLGLADLLLASGIGLGAAVQAWVGAALIRRLVGFPCNLDNARDVLAFLCLGGPVSCLFNATLGSGLLWTFGVIASEQLLYSAWTWWVGDSIGVMIVTPLLLILWGQPRSLWRARQRTLGLPLLLTLALVIVIFMRTSSWESAQLQQNFETRAHAVAERLQTTLAQDLSILQALERLYASQPQVQRDQFRIFVHHALQNVPGIQALTWTPRVQHAERAAFEKATQQLFPSFRIFQLTTDGQRAAAPAAADYYPVHFIEPRAGNEAALGFDTASNPIAAVAQTQARNTGRASATAPLTLVQEHGTQRGVVIYQPVYLGGTVPPTEAARHHALRGYVSVVFRMDDLVQQALEPVLSATLRLQIDDITDAEQQLSLYRLDRTDVDVANGDPHWSTQLEVAGRVWQLSLSESAIYHPGQAWLAWLVLAGGFLFSALLGAFLLVVTGYTVKIEQLVQARTQDLAQANRAATASNALLSAISQAQSDFISAADTQQAFVKLLAQLLDITESEYGCIATLHRDETATAQLALYCVTQRDTQSPIPLPTESSSLTNLFEPVMQSQTPKLCTVTSDEHQRWLGLPILKGEHIIGVLGLASPVQDYSETLIKYLKPVLNTLANLLDAYRIEQLRSSADQALRESESRLQAIFDNALDAIITFDTRGALQSINPAAQQLFGYDAQELLGQSWLRLLPTALHNEIKGAFARYLESGSNDLIGCSRELDAVRSDATRVPIEIAISAVHSETGLLFTAIAHDLTERRRVDRLQNEFISTVSHELRTPLTSILGSLGLINGGALGNPPEAFRPLLDNAHRNSTRLLNLINDLLDIDKIESGQLSVKLTLQPLLPLVIQAIDSNRGFADNFGVKLHLLQAELSECWVRVDTDRFIQILNNLISNAVKFSPNAASVDIRLSCEHGQAVLAVHDQGPGIPPAFRAKVFKKFAQADASDSRSHPGTGLGLHISKALVEKMRGHISYECPATGGTVFRIRFPLQAAEQRPGKHSASL